MTATSLAAQQAAELHRAEREARGWRPEEFSVAGVLIWALTLNGQSSVVSGLLDLIERQLFAASTAEAGGQETTPWTEAAHRFTQAAIELDRRERAGRDAAEGAKREEEAEAEAEENEAEEDDDDDDGGDDDDDDDGGAK
jgi:hypothetical protein